MVGPPLSVHDHPGTRPDPDPLVGADIVVPDLARVDAAGAARDRGNAGDEGVLPGGVTGAVPALISDGGTVGPGPETETDSGGGEAARGRKREIEQTTKNPSAHGRKTESEAARARKREIEQTINHPSAHAIGARVSRGRKARTDCAKIFRVWEGGNNLKTTQAKDSLSFLLTNSIEI